MKKLNSSYFEFFFFSYGIIIILALSFMLPFYYVLEKDFILLLCLTAMPFLFFVPVSFLDYRSLKKNIDPANVFLTYDGLIINEVYFHSDQIEEISLIRASNTQDKSYIPCFEVKTNDGDIFYFIDKRSDWKFQSPTMKLLRKHPAFASKTKEKTIYFTGFKAFKKKKTTQK